MRLESERVNSVAEKPTVLFTLSRVTHFVARRRSVTPLRVRMSCRDRGTFQSLVIIAVLFNFPHTTGPLWVFLVYSRSVCLANISKRMMTNFNNILPVNFTYPLFPFFEGRYRNKLYQDGRRNVSQHQIFVFLLLHSSFPCLHVTLSLTCSQEAKVLTSTCPLCLCSCSTASMIMME